MSAEPPGTAAPPAPPASTAELARRATRATLAAWARRPAPVLAGWLAGSLGVAVAMLVAVWLLARRASPDPTPLLVPGLTRPAAASDVLAVLHRNGLVLALHALACVAGFLAGTAMPLEAARRQGRARRVHELAGRGAIAFVVAATGFSLVTQVLVLGDGAAALAAQLGIGPGTLLVGLLPHAAPELVALFLPLAAWLSASRAGRWEELLAATLVTGALAVPTLVAAAVIEVYVSPDWLRTLTGLRAGGPRYLF